MAKDPAAAIDKRRNPVRKESAGRAKVIEGPENPK
jgi:hypothetical protein